MFKVKPSKPLEVLLLEKNRCEYTEDYIVGTNLFISSFLALQNENTSLKLELSELRGRSDRDSCVDVLTGYCSGKNLSSS